MQRCIYCPTEFDDAPKEHVIHAFLGARWKDGKLICQACQTLFAGGIDTMMSERLQPFRLFLGIEGDHGGTGKNLTDLPVTSGETIDIGPGGTPILGRPHVTVTELPSEQHNVSIKIGNERDINWALSEVRKAIPYAKLDVEAIKKLGVKKKDRLGGAVTFNINLGGKDFFRSVLKCCANLFAAHDAAARTAFLELPFDAVRAYIHDGAGNDSDFVRWLVSGVPLDLPKRGEADQTILLTSRAGNVEGVIRFFGQLAFAVRLAANYAGPPIRCAYVVDPYREADPAEQRISGDQLSQYDEKLPLFAEQSPGNSIAVQAAWDAALNRFMAYYAERENESIVQEATDEAIRRDSHIATLPREKVVEMLRGLVQKRFDRFERTGDATGIITIGINTPQPDPDAEQAAE